MCRKITALILSVLIAVSALSISAAAADTQQTEKDFIITDPYAAVDWDSWGAYKTQLHSHTTASDGYQTIHEFVRVKR